MQCTHVATCHECGDRLIHQSNRGPDESSSAFGQWVHDHLKMEMYWLDIDGGSYKRATKVLRIVEHKPRGVGLRESQKEILPLLAKALQLLAATRLIHEQSGVFIVHSDHPHDSALVEQVTGWPGRGIWLSQEMRGDDWERFVTGDVLDLRSQAA